MSPEPNEDGQRTLTFGVRRTRPQASYRSVKTETRRRSKADPADNKQVGAPIPAMVSSVSVTVSQQIKKKEKLYRSRSHEDADHRLCPH